MTDSGATRACFQLPNGLVYPGAAAQVGHGARPHRDRGGVRRTGEPSRLAGPARRMGDHIARLVGTAAGTVVMGDTVSIKIYQALAAALGHRGSSECA
jgi:kynureninase